MVYVGIAGSAIGDPQWAEAVTSTLYRGDTINVGDYTVKAVQFHKPMLGVRDINGNITPRDEFEPIVFLELYRNGTLTDEFTLTQFDSGFITADEEVTVTLNDIASRKNKVWVYEYYNPWAKVNIRLRGLPEFNISIETDEDTYTSNRDRKILLNVTIKNEGEGDARNVKASIFTDNLSIYYGKKEDLNPYFSKISEGEKKTIKLELAIPGTILEAQKYILSATVSGYDIKGLYYDDFDYKVIAIVPPDDFILTKYIKDRIYLSETATVILKINNIGKFEVTNISIKDSIPANFELESDSDLEWVIPGLSPGEEKVVGSYHLKPLEANRNGFLFPSSVAFYTIKDNVYFTESGSPRVIVNGPRIIVEKTVNDDINMGEDIEITVTAQNVGNAPTKVIIIDQLPDDSVFIRGNTSLQQTFLDIDSSLKISYIIRIFSEGNHTLPPAVVEYKDISNIRNNIDKKTYSDPVNITVGPISVSEPVQTAFPVFITRTPVGTIPSDDRTIPGFGSKLLVFSMAIIYVYLKKRSLNNNGGRIK